jgi:hypothetical protein
MRAHVTAVLCIGALTVAALTLGGEEPRWVEMLDGSRPPVAPVNGGAALAQGVSATFADGVLHLTDTSKAPGSCAMLGAQWNADPAGATELDGQVKLIAAEGNCGMCLDVADGVHEDALSLYPDHIALWGAGLTYAMDTTDDFHTYRVRIQGGDVQVFADGRLVLDGKGKFVQPAEGGRNNCQFGAGSSTATGEALWKTMRFQMRSPKPVEIAVPEIPGLDVRVGETVPILPGITYAATFQFADGRIACGSGEVWRWSADGGRTWTAGPHGPGNATIELGNGEMLSLGFNTKRRADGKYTLEQKRSLDGWKTVTTEEGVYDIPDSVPCGGDAAETNDGFLIDHGVLRLKNGDLMATAYGTYKGDTSVPADYPFDQFHFYRYRNIVVFSADKGRTWGNPVTVAYSDDPKMTQEGFDEGDLARAADGDILCVMRSGGSFGKHYPSYICRSSDEGKTWSTPVAVDDKGVWPSILVLKNGVVVCTYGRPDNWLSFSTDDGRTWTGATRFYRGPTSSYNSVVEVAPDTILVIYDRHGVDEKGLARVETVGTFFTVKRK